MTSALVSRRSLSGPNRKRLQTLYVVAAAGLAALVPLMLFAGLWIRSELGKSYRDVETYLGSRASTLSSHVDAEIDQQVAALRAISALPGLDEPTFADTARRLTQVMPQWSALSLFETATGRLLSSTVPELGQPPPASTLASVATSRRPLVEARSPGGATAEIQIYYPVVRDGAVPAVLATRLASRELAELVAQQGRQSGLLTIVADRDGRVLAVSDAAGFTVGQRLGEAFRAATDGRDNGVYRGLSEDEPVTSAFQRSPTTGWVAIASTKGRQAERLSTRSVWATIAAGSLSLILAGILTVFIVHTVMERRVSNERLAASRALGDLDARLLATTQDALAEQRKAASEREVLLREIYHRVKNNLQIVQSLLRLGSRDLRPEQREPFESAVRRIGAMARVHTLLYNSPDLASIDFKDYLDELLKELSEGFAAEERSIESVLEADAMRMPLDTAVPLAFIAVEILTNSFKHAFPHGRPGRITVEVHRDQDGAVLTITDNGIGMVDAGGGKRQLGLTIVRKLVQQIGGTLDEPPPGSSTFVVRFPLTDEPGPTPHLSGKMAPEPAPS